MQQKISLHREVRISGIYDHCICALLMLPYFPPTGLIELFDMSWSGVWIAGFVVLLLLSLPTLRHIEKSFIVYGLFYVSVFFSTLINGREGFPVFVLAGKMISFLLLFHYYTHIGKLRCLIHTMKAYLGIMVIITLAIQLIDKEVFGLTLSSNTINLIDSDNFLGYYYIPFMLLVYISNKDKSKRYRMFNFAFWSVICTLSLVNAWAVTCLSIFILFIVLLIFRKWKVFSLLTPLVGLIANAFVNILVIGMQIQKYFSWLIEDIMHKDITLSARTYIWASAIANFVKKPIFGYGTTSGGRMEINSYSIGLNRYTFFSHNVFLEILIQGGIVAMVFFVLLYIVANRSITKTNGHTELKTMIGISLFCVMLMQFSEFAIYIPAANIPLILCFYYENLKEEGLEHNYP